jgi:ribonucleoside-diphosphate reductase alpha chain
MPNGTLTTTQKEEILSTARPTFSASSMEVIRQRHLKRDAAGNVVETPEEMFLRVAEHMALPDQTFDPNANVAETTKIFYQMMANIEFLPGSRILFEAGNEHLGQLASCFVLPIEDDLEQIFHALKEAAIVQKRNGGVGYNFSKIRQKGATVNGLAGVAAGPVHFLHTFSVALSQVMQGSKRHGGNMGILNVNHPDILEFIDAKKEDGEVRNFNISVGATRDFMERVRRDEEYDLIDPGTKEVVGRLRARDIFNKIVENAWKLADPGMIFLDEVQEKNPTPELGVMDATNPCGEQPLLPYESCNLGSLVLSTFVDSGEIQWDRMKRTMHTAVHFMDNMLEINNFPLPQIEQVVRFGNRKIGIGIMGFGHMLYKLKIPYNSLEAVKLAEKIMKFLNAEGHKASGELAQQRGNFPNWEQSIYKKQNKPMRNATVTTIAPTGTLSMVPNCTSGVEPAFSLVNIRRTFFEGTRNVGAGKTLVFVDPVFENVAREEGFYSDELMEHIAREGSLQHIERIPEHMKRVFVTTHDISFDWHVKIQAAFQKYTDNAVSKTINLPHSATVDDVRRAYIMAYELGCKGITVYRDGSKESQILNTTATAKAGDLPFKAAASVSEEKEPTYMAEKKVLLNEDPSASPFPSELTPNALTVLQKRALLRDEKGEVVETPDQLFRRVARTMASAERSTATSEEAMSQWEEKFEEMLSSLEFIPGQALRNATADRLTLSACLVLPVEDSIDGIMRAIAENVIAHKATCGTGFNFSRLRSRNASVGSTGELAAGPVTFMKAFDATQGTIRTKGGRNQGAMAILNIDHPDIEEFIQVKDDPAQMTHYNISVGVTDALMDAWKKDADFDLVDPHTKRVVKTVRARELFRKISEHAWKTGDPGVIFLDAMNERNPMPKLGPLDATNPCGEQPLHPYDTCNLGSIVLPRMVRSQDGVTVEMDWEKLRETIQRAVRFLDNTIDLNRYPLEKIAEVSRANRRIGLGVMGFADLLILLGIPYNSEEAVKLAEELMAFVTTTARAYSVTLGQEKGSFSNFPESIWAGEFSTLRNMALTTIAPTGYTSIVAGCSSGIEPLFALAFQRKNSMGGEDQVEVNQLFEAVAKREGFYSPALMEKIAETGSCQGLADVPEKWQKIFVTSHEISPEWDVKIQAAFQKYTDNAVSKTINFPHRASVEDIEAVYRLAHELHCKGVTIFRDGSKDIQVMHVGTKEKKEEKDVAATEREESLAVVVPGLVPGHKIVPRERPEVTRGRTYKISTAYGSLFVTINDDAEAQPFEVFATIGKAGGFFAAKSEAICRMISLALRSGISAEDVIAQLKGIRGPMPSWGKKGMILSIPDAIAQILEEHLKKDQAKLNLDYNPAHDQEEANDLREASEQKEDVEYVQTSPLSEETGIPDELMINPIDQTLEEEVEVNEELPLVPSSVVSAPAYAEALVTRATEEVTTPAGTVIHATAAVNSKVSIANVGFAPECPDCGNLLEFGEGCMMCRNCGYSKCG